MRILFVTTEGNEVAKAAEDYVTGLQTKNGTEGGRHVVASIWPEAGRTPAEQVALMDQLVSAVAKDEKARLCVLSTSPYVLRAIQVRAAECSMATHVGCVLLRLDGSMEEMASTEPLFDSWVRPLEDLEARIIVL
jgi:hypothetical protein